jgi:glycosyltransferase involved in cell wall biosynthesis
VKILHLVSVADSQSIPLELALALRHRHPGTVIVAFRAAGDHPVEHAPADVICLGASGPFDVRAILRLRRLLVRHSPDIIHLHHAVSAFWAAVASLSVRPMPILVKTEHNDHRSQPWYQGAINLALYPFFRAIVCNSDSTLASFSATETWLSGARGLRIYNGLDLTRVRAKGRGRARGDGPFHVGHVGRLVAQKNQARLIEGLAIARTRSDRDIRLEIVGNGPLMPTLRELARKAGVADAVVFCGAVTRDAVYDKLATWDAFVMPSAFEGFCNALVEAMAAGLPVAVSDIDTLREVAGDGAQHFDQTDPEAIATALLNLTRRHRAPDSFVDRYDMANTVARHLALYAALLSGRGPQARMLQVQVQREGSGGD